VYRFDTWPFTPAVPPPRCDTVAAPFPTITSTSNSSSRSGIAASATRVPSIPRGARSRSAGLARGRAIRARVASGMAATHNLLSLAAPLRSRGSRLRLVRRRVAISPSTSQVRHRLHLLDSSDPAAVERAIRPETKLLWLDTPRISLPKVTDIAACSAIRGRAEFAPS